jgi:ABC-2 type transport system ATP-binding protein
MRSLGAQGKTVLVSSHILAEVQQVADTVSIIGHGRLLASGRVADLVGGGTAPVRVGVDEPDRAASVLRASGWEVRVDGERLVVEGVEDPSRITRALADERLYVRELVALAPDLEQVFLELTAGVDSAGGEVHAATEQQVSVGAGEVA